MSRFVFALCLACASLVGFTAEQKVIVAKGASKALEPGFLVEQFQVIGARDVVTVDVSAGTARVTGTKEGACSVRLIGAGNMESVFEVAVGNDLAGIKGNLLKELEEVSGVEIDVVGSSLRVQGEVNDPDAWQLLQDVLDHPDYRSRVKDRTRFRIQADTLKNFYQQFKDAHFKLVDDPKKAHDGALYVRYDGKLVFVSGKVYSAKDAERIKDILKSNAGWLRLEEEIVKTGQATAGQGTSHKESAASETRREWRPLCRMDIDVDERLLHMDVVLIDYDETSGRDYGTDHTPLNVSTKFSSLWNLVAGNTESQTISLDADLTAVLDFMKKSNISRHSVGGYMRFKCNDPAAAKLKIGGTLKVKMKATSSLGGANEDFEDISYGFELEKKSANLVDDGHVDMKLDISQKKPLPMEDGGYEEGYNVQERTFNPTLVCPLGKTVVISGYSNFSEATAPLSGIPILRNIPLLGWAVAKESDSSEDTKIMMLISVREVRPDEPEVQDAKLPYERCKNLTTEVQVSNAERIEARKRWHGCLYWMNWFAP